MQNLTSAQQSVKFLSSGDRTHKFCPSTRRAFPRLDANDNFSRFGIDGIHKIWSVGVSTLIALSCGLGLGSPVLAFDSQPSIQQSQTDGLTIKFKASKNSEVRKAQEALVETWGYVATQFLDINFNGVDWQKQLQESLDESAGAENARDVYKVTDAMLSKLGDPFTRVIPPNTMGAYEDALEGQIVGMGFQVVEDKSGSRTVVFVAEGSPAQRQGMQVGDKLLQINGKDASTVPREEMAAILRVAADVELAREGVGRVLLHLEAEPIQTHPVQYATLHQSRDSSQMVGYIRLMMFSKNAPQDVANAIIALKDSQAQAFILDLRDNVGGIILSGYEVAQLFLPAGSPFCFVEDGRGASEDVSIPESNVLTQQPLVVLVNGGTASTAELISASLQDNQRATLVGEKTFGKGKTQRVIKLRDNGLLLLSNTLYRTPRHTNVDRVGLEPNVLCKPERTESAFWTSGSQEDTQALLEDPCIHMALALLSPSD